MRKDSVGTYKRMKNLAEKVSRRHSGTACCIELQVWAGGAWRKEAEMSFSQWLGGSIGAHKKGSLAELEEAANDSTT